MTFIEGFKKFGLSWLLGAFRMAVSTIETQRDEIKRLEDRIDNLQYKQSELVIKYAAAWQRSKIESPGESTFATLREEAKEVNTNDDKHQVSLTGDLKPSNLYRRNAHDILEETRRRYDEEMIDAQEKVQEEMRQNSGLVLNPKKADLLIQRARAAREGN